MKFHARTLRDPYEGRGFGLAVSNEKRRYEIDFGAGLSHNLFEAQITLTPPFNPESFNTKGENDYKSDLKHLQFKVALLWIQLNISFYIIK